MRMRLKYMIGGALLSLATLAASGPADAFLIDENPPNGTGLNIGDIGNPIGGPISFATPAALATFVGATLIERMDGGVATGGDTVIVGALNSTWQSAVNDALAGPEIENFASTGTSRSKPSLGSPRTIVRRVTGISSGATIPAKACRQSGASRGAEEQRPECGQTDQDPKD
jgi:hypothetical protein